MSYQNKIMEIKQILNSCTNKERESILNEIIYYVSEKNNININKLTNGSISENLVCSYLKFKWNKNSVHGADCFDNNGKKIEIKTFLMPTKNSKTKRANVNYRLPIKKKKETQEQYYEKIKLFIENNEGGHVWASLNRGKTSVINCWIIDSKKFSIAIVDKCKINFQKTNENLKSLNFGCNICNNCGKLHRIENIVKLVNEESLIPKRIKQNC